ncbi:MAG: PadR family transcriptional regulator [Pedosphaera sp.]|nr:PadR family transcriptional regulator [Pedosphaera sp.]
MLSKELIAASTRPILLSILERGENYGYALLQEIEKISAGQIVWSEGMLYPVLHRMENEGIIESFWQEAEKGRPRKYYKITEKARPIIQVEKQQWSTVNQVLKKLWKPVKPIRNST